MKVAICCLALLAVVMAGHESSLVPHQISVGSWAEFANGCVEGIVDNFNEDLFRVQRCIAFPVCLYNEIASFVNYIIHIDWSHFDIEAFFDNLYTMISNIGLDVYPCIILGFAIDKIVELILSPTIETLQDVMLQSFCVNMMIIVSLVQQLILDLVEFSAYAVGHDLTSILYIFVVH